MAYLWNKIKTLVNSKTEKNIITAYISSTQTVTASADSYGVVALNSSVKTGEKLTFNSSTHQIQIGAGVSKIQITGQIRFNNAWNTGLTGSAIFKNGSAVAVTTAYKYNTTTALGIVVAPRVIEVAENDVIDLRYYAGVSISSKTLGTANGTYLTVEVME